MRLFKPLTPVLFFFLSFFYSQSAFALKYYTLTSENFVEVFQEIKANYYTATSQTQIVDSLESFLLSRLHLLYFEASCKAPDPEIFAAPQGGLIFDWNETGATHYLSSYFNLFTADADDFITTGSQVTIPLFSYSFHLFAFLSSCDRLQGHLNLIIVERDIFSLKNPGGNSVAVANDPVYSAFSCSPNPVSDHLRLNYQLKKAGSAAIEIRDLNGRLVRATLNKGNLPKGNYSEEISLSGLTAGMYFCTLIAERPHTIRLIKKE